MQRSEWIKFFAMFYNEEYQANLVFDEIDSRYQCHVANINYLYPSNRPVVAWVQYNMGLEGAPDTWTVSFAEWKQTLTEDAGSSFVYCCSTLFFMSFFFSNAHILIFALLQVAPCLTQCGRRSRM